MTVVDVLDVIEILMAAAPSFKPSNPTALRSLWERRFSGVDGEVLRKAADMHIDRSKYFPSPAEIQELIPLAEYQVENKRITTNLFELRAVAIELENRYYHEGLFERGEWEKLIGRYGAHGHAACVDATRSRMEAISALYNAREA